MSSFIPPLVLQEWAELKTNLPVFHVTCDWYITYRVFFIEGQIRISCKMLKILLFHGGFGLRTEVTMGNLISDQFKTHF